MNEQKKKINISVDDETYDELRRKAEEEYIRLATYVKQLISKRLDEINNRKYRNFLTKDESMEK